ncbi:hypothetical protein GCM10008171_29100 [Methylopila jiangsuensis]|uniref:Uncharacterized protein n=1 Tax=Methylopila jiangsuensis TaxID=586230 RepID=A0A9W6JHC9_9HYPH|nr:hypothetical protein GCM10008171_29100 [Methylopila jiangsuensis]
MLVVGAVVVVNSDVIATLHVVGPKERVDLNGEIRSRRHVAPGAVGRIDLALAAGTVRADPICEPLHRDAGAADQWIRRRAWQSALEGFECEGSCHAIGAAKPSV